MGSLGRIAAVCVLIVAALSAEGQVAQSAGNRAHLQVRGTNMIVANSSVEVTVRFPRDVPLRNIDVSMRGGRGSRAVALVTPSDPRRSVFWIGTRSCSPAGCADGVALGQAKGLDPKTLDAGTYRLIALVDEQQSRRATTFRLQIKDLGGRLSLSDEATPAQATLGDITMKPVDSSETGVFSGGTFLGDESHEGFTAMIMWWKNEAYKGAAFSSCYYTEEPRIPREQAFLPGCPTGGSHPKVDSPETSQEGSSLLSMFEYIPVGLGGWYASGVGESVGGASVMTIRPL